MYKRINDFEKLATQYANSYSDFGDPAWLQFYNEKFAELVIERCISCIKIQSLNDEITESWVYETLADSVKDQFGVK